MPLNSMPSLPLLSPSPSPFCASSSHLISNHNRFKYKVAASSDASISGSSSDRPQGNKSTGVVVVGAGLAGLAAATRLEAAKIPFLLVEASDGVGGRVRTDNVDGFLLDRGFQIFITAYPEARKVLDYRSLKLRNFYSGARVYFDGKFHTVSDPFRHFMDSVKSLTNPIGSVFDKIRIGLVRARSMAMAEDEIMTSDEVPIAELLRSIRFSDSIIHRFFKPFFGGIFFDPELKTTSRLFYFIFKCLALGNNTLPENGIGAISDQLAAKLPPNSVLLNSRVVSVDPKQGSSQSSRVKLLGGLSIEAKLGVIVAVEQPEIRKILSGNEAHLPESKPGRSTVTLYFASVRDMIPVKEPILFLNGSGQGIVNNMFFPTNVAPSYGPPEKALVSVTAIGSFDGLTDDELTSLVVKELSGWFGEEMARSWTHLRTYRIGFAQPDQTPPTNLRKDPKVAPGLYLCGDHWSSATFDGAMASGRRAAECLLRDVAST